MHRAALSRIEDPKQACRPFAEDRAGTVLGEGAGALLLETRDSALERGANIRGEILGYGESSDATHLTSPNPEGQAKAMRMALKEAGVAEIFGHGGSCIFFYVIVSLHQCGFCCEG